MTPPASDAVPNPAPDVTSQDALSLYQAAYTAWSALLLLVPVYLFVFSRGTVWLAFWTVSFVAYAIHIAVSAFGFFGGDFEWMTNSTRVSAFWPGMALLVWWPIDLALAFAQREGMAIRVQRVLLHIVTLVLFVGGSAIKGELMVTQIMGWVLLAAAVLSLVRWRLQR